MLRRTAPRMDGKIAILFGSATGTAESYAKMLATYAVAHGFEPVVCSMNDGINVLKARDKALKAVVFVCSTAGTGEFPSNAAKFWSTLDSGALFVADVPYTIMGLGNSKNDNFNAAAKRLDRKMKVLGGKTFLRLHLSCELENQGHDAVYRSFKRAIWASLGAATGVSTATAALRPTYTLKEQAATIKADTLQTFGGTGNGFAAGAVESNELLTPAGYLPHHRLLSLHVPAAVQKQQLGGRLATLTDHVQVAPRCDPALVTRAAARLGVSLDTVFQVVPSKGAARSYFDNAKLSARAVLTELVDLSAMPTRSLLEVFATLATDAAEKTALDELANDLGANSKYDTLCAGIFTIVDALEMFPKLQLSLEMLFSYAPHIAARTYSVANNIAANGSESFEVVYSVPHRALTTNNKVHDGLATSTMERAANRGDQLSVRFVPSGIALPAVDRPLLIVALGSAIGTARALLQHRAAAKKAGQTVAKAVLFYGFRHLSKDALFTAELDGYVADGLLDVRRVASHDQAAFVTPMDTFDASVKDFLSTNGEVYYCGLGGSAPVLVEGALRRVGVDVGTLRLSKRYHEEYFTADFDMENLLKNHAGAAANAGTLTARIGKCEMFCFQCEQTKNNTGCTKVGVCGKSPKVAALQDLTVHLVKVLGFYLHELRALGAAESHEANRLSLYALFSTLTNVNFDETRFMQITKDINEAIRATEAQYTQLTQAKGVETKNYTGVHVPRELPTDEATLMDLCHNVGVLTRFTDGKTQSAAAVGEMLMYGLKGLAAYTDHSLMNGKENPAIYAYLHKALAFLVGPNSMDLGQALGLCLECGNANVTAMSQLYDSNKTLGVPTPTVVPVKPQPGKAILVSGHDLVILKALLEKTEPLGINVYTHGEMLPAHSYPELKKFKNLVGNYGGAWMRQSLEWAHFPGSILATSNCITAPESSYSGRMFTCGAVGWAGISHAGNNLSDINFDGLIAAAQKAKGFAPEETRFTYPDPVGQRRPASYTVGFGHETILSVAPLLIEQIQKGNISRFFVVGGCDGYEGSRSYFTDLVAALPPTAVVLTVGCGKYRINHLELGTIGDTGIPRILDMGQCNDSFSAVQVALALADVLKCKVSDLPLSIVLSWFEQKAVAVLLSCLALGLKPIRVGPSLPAFVTPEVVNVLVSQFGIKPVGDPVADAKEMCAATGAS